MWHGATAQTGQSLLVPRCTLERFERRKDTASLEGYRGECAVFPGENKSQTLPPLTFATVCIAMHWIADANGRDTLCRFDLELNAATIELGYLRSRDDLLADWRCRQMKQGLIALRAGVLHGHDHDRCRQYGWQSSVLEAIGKVFSGYHQRE